MGKKKKGFVAELNKFALRANLELKYEDVEPEGPERFFKKAVVGDEVYTGVGNDEKEAQQNAAKKALRSLNQKENPGPVREKAAKNPPAQAHQKSVLNDRVNIRAVASARPEPNNVAQCCSLAVGDKEYTAITEKAKGKAKKKARKLVFDGMVAVENHNSSSAQQHGEINLNDICNETRRLSLNSKDNSLKETNYIGLVNHYCQKTNSSHTFIEDRRCGPSHNLRFFYKLVINNKDYPVGEGKNIKEAKQNAALLAWSALQEQSDWNSKNAKIPENVNTGSPLRENTSTQEVSSRFTSEFDCIEPLGKGAFGHVLKARCKLTGKYYAVKIVPCKEIKRALREVKALSDLHHPNIVRYFTCWLEDSGNQWGSPGDSCSTSQSSIDSSSMKYLYIQMELCDTKTLRVWIDDKNAKTSLGYSKRRDEGLLIAQQIVSGVEYIHSMKLIHRDLKPANIMFGQDGKVKIGDFGLVTDENDDDAENLMERTVCKGTPSYMAPEQKSEKTYDRKVDIFALGLIYFELLWKLSTCHERQMVWGDIRTQKFPELFPHYFHQEHIILRPMLSMKPEKRPEASQLKTDLEVECSRRLSIQKNKRCGSRTV